jgi:predicted transcriptional regulator
MIHSLVHSLYATVSFKNLNRVESVIIYKLMGLLIPPEKTFFTYITGLKQKMMTVIIILSIFVIAVFMLILDTSRIADFKSYIQYSTGRIMLTDY